MLGRPLNRLVLLSARRCSRAIPRLGLARQVGDSNGRPSPTLTEALARIKQLEAQVARFQQRQPSAEAAGTAKSERVAEDGAATTTRFICPDEPAPLSRVQRESPRAQDKSAFWVAAVGALFCVALGGFLCLAFIVDQIMSAL